jgi:hypothetical protein
MLQPAGLKAIRDRAQTDTMRAQAVLDSAAQQPITTTVLRKFAATARQRMRIESGGYRRDHLRALAQGVEVPTTRSASCDPRAICSERSLPFRA